MTIVRDAVRMVLIMLTLAGIAVALGAAWLVDRVYEATTA